MKSPPKFLHGAYRSALRIALREICEGAAQHDETRQTRGWKLLVLLPRMVLFRPPRGGLIPQLLIEGRECCEVSMNVARRPRRRQTASKGRESTNDGHDGGCSVGFGTNATLRQLRQRPQEPGLHNLDFLPQDRPDTRRLEVVIDGLPLHHGAQLAIDTTMVSPLRHDGVPRPRSMMVDGASLATASK